MFLTFPSEEVFFTGGGGGERQGVRRRGKVGAGRGEEKYSECSCNLCSVDTRQDCTVNE